MDKDLVVCFLLKSTIPGLEMTDSKQKLELDTQKFTMNVQAVLKRAHRDVLTGRFYLPIYCSKKCDNKNLVVQSLEELILDNETELTSANLIDALLKEYPDVEFGAIQKLVNMTLKYIMVINSITLRGLINVDESKCDCPIDSIILEKLKERNGKAHTHWTKMYKNEYYEIQSEIHTLIGDHYGNILFDFYNW